MTQPTVPPIYIAENTDDAQRMVAAQARIYSDAKILFAGRVVAVFVLATGSAVVAISFPSLRTLVGGGGGVLLLVASFVVGGVERWLRMRAAATQEQFDTQVFQLPWNGVHADRPPQNLISRAARRYKDGREKNWYDDTKGTHRPFDVLICQGSNLGWGASMHLIWAWILIGSAVLLVVLVAVVQIIIDLSGSDFVVSLVVPALAPLKEIGEQVKANFDAARSKESAERKVNELWTNGMNNGVIPSEGEVRAIQDKILLFRQSNPYVPDWLDSVFHAKNEAAMRATVADRVAQAQRHGHADPPAAP